MTPEEFSYYRERARIERECAAESTNPHAAEIHEKLAVLYEDLVKAGEANSNVVNVPVWTARQ